MGRFSSSHLSMIGIHEYKWACCTQQAALDPLKVFMGGRQITNAQGSAKLFAQAPRMLGLDQFGHTGLR